MATAEKVEAKSEKSTAIKGVGLLDQAAVEEISGELRHLLADLFALYLKTKNFHWHVSGAHFRDFHLMFDEHAAQIFAMTDAIAERVRKVGGSTLRSIGQISRSQRILDNDAEFVTPQDMLSELGSDNRQLTGALREAHDASRIAMKQANAEA